MHCHSLLVCLLSLKDYTLDYTLLERLYNAGIDPEFMVEGTHLLQLQDRGMGINS